MEHGHKWPPKEFQFKHKKNKSWKFYEMLPFKLEHFIIDFFPLAS